MDKYGVAQEDGSPEKTSSEKAWRCPSCGGELQRLDTVNVLYCHKCGTKPYEGRHAGR